MLSKFIWKENLRALLKSSNDLVNVFRIHLAYAALPTSIWQPDFEIQIFHWFEI